MPVIMLTSVAVMTGCTVIKEFPAAEQVPEKKKIEHELAEKLLKAFITNDAKGFVALLPEDTQKKFDTEAFKKYRKKSEKIFRGFFKAAQAAKGGLGVATPTRFPQDKMSR